MGGPITCAYPDGFFAIEVLETNAEQSQATLVIRHWTERNRYALLADVEEYRLTGTTSDVQQVDVYYDRPFRFVIPKSATTFQISGTSLTRQPITVVRDQPSPFFVNKVEVDLPPNKKEIIYQVVPPRG